MGARHMMVAVRQYERSIVGASEEIRNKEGRPTVKREDASYQQVNEG